MVILPATAGTDVATSVASTVADNIVPIVALIGLGVGVRLVMGLTFKRATNKIKA